MGNLIGLIAIVVWVGIGCTSGLPYYLKIRHEGEPATMALVKAIWHGAVTPVRKSIEGLKALYNYIKS